MPRFYISPQHISQSRVVIDGSQAHHIINVLRLETGDEITLFDGSGYEYNSQIIDIQSGKLVAQIKTRVKPAVESPLELTLGQALIKGDKMELIIQKATELGVSRIIPLKTARSRRISPDVLIRKQERWQDISTEAAQLCGRIKLPQIERCFKFSEFCADFETADLKLIFWEKEGHSLKNTLTKIKPPKQVAVLVGPEGSFNQNELQTAQEHGFIPVGLGPRILRAETAAIAALSLIQYQLGDIK